MDNSLFCKSFHFAAVTFKDRHHTDNSAGIDCNFIGRLLEGRAEFVSEDDGVMELSKGDVFYLPFGLKYHSYWYPERGAVRFESYRFNAYPSSEPVRYSMQKLFPTQEELKLIDLVAADMSINAVSVGRLFEFFGAQIPKMKLAHFDSKAALLAKAKEYMASCKNFRVAELARHLGLSETSVYGFFRNLGTTPINVKNEILLEEAKRLLCQTDLSVEQICGRVGFSSVAYFRKIVKESTGKNPLQLRRENSVESKI